MANQLYGKKPTKKTNNKRNKTYQIVGIFSNGFIKLVQKTDRTHSKCHLFLVGGLPHKPTQATFFSMSAREKQKAEAIYENHGFCLSLVTSHVERRGWGVRWGRETASAELK